MSRADSGMNNQNKFINGQIYDMVRFYSKLPNQFSRPQWKWKSMNIGLS